MSSTSYFSLQLSGGNNQILPASRHFPLPLEDVALFMPSLARMAFSSQAPP
eukprot:CAMPEP_0196216728 /NCGR_PEP_ID=MMETSP0912-20130531/32871_1 /TAXON_ID=49265 /ORGANISM="Thalassiosira rotula, Strain GSO102" /LENGTH=50 /DNA_ID=CAMNT_0041493985 /DNA_START=557 /DNA_END=709 /DNA_ORIENTATION=+